MNTREREVMDAREAVIEAARATVGSEDFNTHRGLAESLAAYDALLAEGSASGEGAEAVAYREIRPNGKFVDTPGCYYPCEGRLPQRTLDAIRSSGGRVEYVYAHPQPAQGDCGCYAETSYANGIDETTTHRCAKHAQGEPATVDALAQFIRTIDGNHELGAAALAERIVERFALPQGEQCSALEVFRIAGGDVECTPNPTSKEAMDCLRDLRECYDEELSKPERRPIADEVACSVANVILFGSPNIAAADLPVALVKVALESAFPRGLPAGSDAVRQAWRAAITLANNICVQESDRENANDGDTGWIDGTAECAKRIREFVEPADAQLVEMLTENGAAAAISALTTAEQPSWGQDARDGERLAFLIEHECFVHRMSDTGLWMLLEKDGCPFDGGEHDTPQEAIDASIAAQQRQGSAK